MDNLENIISQVKKMSKSERSDFLNSVASDKKTMEKLSELLKNEDIAKKIKDLFG